MLINKDLANKKVATQFGYIQFNEKGESNDLKPEEQKILGALRGFEYKEDKKKAEPKEDKVDDSKGEVKATRKKSTGKKKAE